jgi:predicted lipid-binding transport protein (Tim44 family)
MNRISFTTFFLFIETLHLAIAVPSLSVILLLQLLEMRAALVIFTIFLLSSPIFSWLSWLMAKGSNWVNTAAAIKAAGGVSGQLYGTLVGGLLGGHLFGTIGAMIMVVLFFGIGMFAGVMLGGYAANRLTDKMQDITP